MPAVSGEADRRIDELARIVGHEAIWQPAVPQRVIVNQAIGERRPIHSYGSRAAEPIAVFDALWAEVCAGSRAIAADSTSADVDETQAVAAVEGQRGPTVDQAR